jgi:hypothetical protein
MNRERETERTAGRDPSVDERGDDPPPEKRQDDADPDHRFRDWALI